MSNLVYGNLLRSQSETAKVVDVCNRLGIHPNWLMCVMHFETGGTLSPRTTNGIGSVGLIQFTRDKAGVQYKTIQGKRYQLADLKLMSFEQQMEVVFLYLQPMASKIKSMTDLYLAVFFPVAMGKAADFVFKTSGLSASKIASNNPIFDRNKDGQIKKSEVTEYFANRYKAYWSQIHNGGSSETTYFTVILMAVVVFFYTYGTVVTVIN